MKLKALAMAGATLALLSGTTANGSVVDRPTFKVGGLVVVWGATPDKGNNVARDFYLLDGTSGAVGDDLTAGDIDGTADAVVTGDLLSVDSATSGGVFTDAGTSGVLDASDTLTEFGIDADTDVTLGGSGTVNGKFYVASNVPFAIHAQAAIDTAQSTFTNLGLANIAYGLDVVNTGQANQTLDFGSKANDFAATKATDIVSGITNLGGLAAETKVYTAPAKTAAAPGKLADQSVGFVTSYNLDTDLATAGNQGFDLSDGTGTLAATVTYTIYNP